MTTEPDRRGRGAPVAGLIVLAAVLVALVLVALVLVGGHLAGADRRQVSTAAQPDDEIGWRWESYAGVEVRVPAAWTYGTTDAPWCGADSGDQPDGEVGRPGPVRGILCAGPPPAAVRGQHVWLSSARGDGTARPGTHRLGDGWVRDVVELAGVRIDLQTRDSAVRSVILGSVRRAGVDANGCPASHPITSARLVRPAAGAAWEATVTGVSICRYDGPEGLHGSRRLAGAAAQRVLDAIEAAPPGAGPVDPTSISADAGRGTVLRFDTAGGVREIFVRYDGSRRNGFDNGTGERRLTRAALTFMSGPLVVNAGPSVTMTLLPRR